MNREVSRRVVIGVVLAAAATLTGPFGTFSSLNYAERLFYWSLAIAGVGIIMNAGMYLGVKTPALARLHLVSRLAIGAAVASPAGGFVIMTLDVVFDRAEFSAPELLTRILFVFGISLAIGVTETYIRPRNIARMIEGESGAVSGGTAIAPRADVERPLFLRNLDTYLGDDLVSISTEDHYLRVVTAAGQERILKRMSDALAELGDFPGLQIHRSHWVALDAIDRVEREGRKCHVVLTNGETFPVSRPNIPALEEALSERV